MGTYIALLRGINVSGHKMIKMEELKKVLSDKQLTRVRTYIQSGNIIFETDMSDSVSLETLIGEMIFKNFRFQVPVVTRKRSELERVFLNNPFMGKQDKPQEKLHVTFLTGIPDTDKVEKIPAAQFLPDEFVVDGREIYLFCSNGYGQTKLTNTYFENKFKLTATTRNWKTVGTLLNMSGQ